MYKKLLHIFHKTTFIVFLLFFGVINFLWCQEIGKPFVQSYLPKTYQAATQNWAVLQDHLGIMYFGNNEGVLQFDGVNWQVTPVSNKSSVRSLDIDHNGIIYVGANNEFGYLRPSISGKLEYESLSKLLPKTEQTFSDVWRTWATKQGIFFQSNAKLFRWANGKLKTWTPKRRFGYTVYVQGRMLVRESGDSQTYQVIGDSLMPITNLTDEYDKDAITAILPYDGDKLLIHSLKKSFQIYDLSPKSPKLFTKLPTDIDSLIAQNGGIYYAQRQPNGIYALSIRKVGTVLMDKSGKMLKKLAKSEGLHTVTHYYNRNDDEGGLWIGANNGVIYTEVNSPITLFNDRQGLDGTVYCIHRHEGILYVGTNLGLFYLDKITTTFKQIEGLSNAVWELLSSKQGNENKLLAVSNGLLEVKNFKVAPITVSNSYMVCPSKKNSQRIYHSGKDFVSTYLYKNGKWEKEGIITSKGNDFRALLEDKKGNLWVSSYLDGIRYIKPNGNIFDSTATIVRYDSIHGLPMKENVFFEVGGEMLVCTEKGIKRFSEEGNRFVPYTKFGTQFGDGTYKVTKLIEDKNNNVWISAEKNGDFVVGVAEYLQDGTYKWNPTPYYRIPEMTETQIYPDLENITWFGGAEGLFRFDGKIKKNYDKKTEAIISRVLIGENSDSLLFGGVFSKDFKKDDGEMIKVVNLTQPKEQVPFLNYGYNSLTFEFALPSYDDIKSNQYSHILEGYEEAWSNWSTATRKEYTNLFEGTYIFKVKARNIYGVESEMASYKFTVLPPWYRSGWAYIAYVILAALAIYTFIWIGTRRLQAENEKLERIVQERTAQITQQKEEILVQAENLKDAMQAISAQNVEINKQKEQVERAYDNVRVLSEIGQKITSTLNLDEISQLVYKNVNSLMDASGFGLGVYNKEKKTIDFEGFVEKGEILPNHYDSLTDENSLAVQCLKTKKEIIINDFRHEYVHYRTRKADAAVGDVPASIIYLPLQVEENAVGVVTVQSFTPHAYNENNLTILRTLASYVSIAIANANSYHIIDEKNKHITDSIRYARTIQQASLPGRKRMAEALNDYFVIFKPKDIVSGDFYWLSHVVETNEETGERVDKVFLAVADCTGHGVPGGFMSMIGNNLLNEIIKMQHIYDPAKVLELLDEGVILALRQNEKSNDDGMDIMLTCLEYGEETLSMTMSGAKTSLYYVKQGESVVNEIRGDNRLIGGTVHKTRPFTNKGLILNRGDMFYMSSDGFADQNSPEGLKFGKDRFKEFFAQHAGYTTNDQKSLLETALASHQQDTPQRDDITVVGVRL
jgi:serine phosphatase RsbU (regulator of sigma subunit)/ligand-binding sensor domain-containing protein